MFLELMWIYQILINPQERKKLSKTKLKWALRFYKKHNPSGYTNLIKKIK